MRIAGEGRRKDRLACLDAKFSTAMPANFGAKTHNPGRMPGPFEDQVVKNMGLADQRLASQANFKKNEIPKLPSHYEYLKENIYDGRG